MPGALWASMWPCSVQALEEHIGPAQGGYWGGHRSTGAVTSAAFDALLEMRARALERAGGGGGFGISQVVFPSTVDFSVETRKEHKSNVKSSLGVPTATAVGYRLPHLRRQNTLLLLYFTFGIMTAEV